MTDNELPYYLAFSLFPGIGPLRFKLLKEYFGSPRLAWYACLNDLKKTGLGDKISEHFDIFRKGFSFEEEEEKLHKKQIAYIPQYDKLYPELLQEIPDPPIGLFIRGDLGKVWGCDRMIGVVGTRQVTPYGRHMTAYITGGLVRAGITIVSGMAYGVDTVAHEAAIANDGKTVAVLGCGVDIVHPLSNLDLYNRIIGKYGLVISEFPPGLMAAKGLFPARNRIISGLSLGTVVTEGAQDSGSLITARFALEQGREVFAVPGQADSYLSRGPLKLIKEGARMVTCAEDILEELHIKSARIGPISHINLIGNQADLTKDERKILEILKNEPLHFDEIVRRSKLAPSLVGSLLTQMEMKNIIRNDDNTNYTLNQQPTHAL